MDPFSLLLLAQSAVSAIRSGCEILQQGNAVIDEFKGEVESVVGQVQETIETVTGLWDWVRGLFGASTQHSESVEPTVTAIQASKPVAKKTNRRTSEPDPDILQMQTVHDVSQQLGKFFDIQNQILTHYKNLEDTSMHVYEADQNHAMKAIERVEVELQLEEMTVKIRETMVYAPKELKDLYTRFLQMYGKIKDEQEFARQEQIMQSRYKKAREWQHRNLKIDLAMWAVGMGMVWVVLVAMLMQIASLSGQSLEWFSLESFASFVSQLQQ